MEECMYLAILYKIEEKFHCSDFPDLFFLFLQVSHGSLHSEEIFGKYQARQAWKWNTLSVSEMLSQNEKFGARSFGMSGKCRIESFFNLNKNNVT